MLTKTIWTFGNLDKIDQFTPIILMNLNLRSGLRGYGGRDYDIKVLNDNIGR